MPWLFCPLPPNVSFFYLLTFLLPSLTVQIIFLPLGETVALLPFLLQSPSLCQVDTRPLSQLLSSHSLVLLWVFFPQLFPIFPVWTSFFPWLPFNSCLVSQVSHLSVSLIFFFFFSASLWDELISSVPSLPLPHFSGNLSPDCPSFSPYPWHLSQSRFPSYIHGWICAPSDVQILSRLHKPARVQLRLLPRLHACLRVNDLS